MGMCGCADGRKMYRQCLPYSGHAELVSAPHLLSERQTTFIGLRYALAREEGGIISF